MPPTLQNPPPPTPWPREHPVWTCSHAAQTIGASVLTRPGSPMLCEDWHDREVHVREVHGDTKVFALFDRAAFCMQSTETNSSGRPLSMSMRASAFCRSMSNFVRYVSMYLSVRLEYMNFTISWEMISIASGANCSRRMLKICAAPSTLPVTFSPTDAQT